ncbi:MAG: sodium:solute symporter family protein [Pirellulales bacterium]
MELHWIDIAIIVLYMLGMVAVGFIVERRARLGLDHYFLGGNKMPWWVLSMSNAASMFDISGTIWLITLLYVYGLKSVFIPWLWPVFNQIFLMVYLSAWLRRSGAMTGAEWITMRFGRDAGAEASRLSVVLFALVSVIAFTGYAFVGIAKFSAIFLPDAFSPNTYAVIIIGVTTLYTVAGGLYSVVLTDLIQFLIMIVCSFALGFIAMQKVSPETLAAVVPEGWADISFGWVLDLDWSEIMPVADKQMEADGFTMFGAFLMMTVFKGVLLSAAGPAPNYDMQRILAAKNPKEAAMMSGLVTVVLFVPRYFMIAGITVLALLFLRGDVTTGDAIDLEQVLPIVIRDFVPVGLAGLLIAGLLAAFMSTFSGTINAAAAYLVNDLYKRYVRPEAEQRVYVRASYAASLAVVVVGCTAGYYTPSVADAVIWIVSGLWGGYAAANILKWYWWRLNGFGYFAGMVTGIGGALAMLFVPGLTALMAQPAISLISLWHAGPPASVNLDLMAFPMLLAISLLGTIVGTYATPPEREDVLVNFYTRTRPWGWWAPIREAAIRRDPEFQPNRNFGWDAFNVVVGIVWQTAFVTLPIYVVIREWRAAAICAAIIIVASTVLKHTWYDRLEN